MLTGEKFLPTLGQFAQGNMGIIQQGLQQLFSWMQNAGPQGGLGIFNDLENIFQERLPTSIHAVRWPLSASRTRSEPSAPPPRAITRGRAEFE